jgi:DNA-binding LacI/PurR family transcriptional regulator
VPGKLQRIRAEGGRGIALPEHGPTAILASSDQLALGVIARATELGLSVPEDVSVVGFDDIPAAASADPPLTTVHQDHAEKGLLAGRMLVSELRKEDGPGAGPLATSLVVRGSTAAPRGR